ncbi:nuclease-related domain-containing protein [Nocardioides aurantiacus]|uniref:Nuclease-like protein n=1 Tax=Nocardioides aurantiacus TaxID=86796 RepID=A0A3N2D077_9ACTN|nr:nuclease-related domain-containing protein [Nocardioides aurantiacus]ROR93058.1 nuclease-like protein [Nocardioides aurantiacus]
MTAEAELGPAVPHDGPAIVVRWKRFGHDRLYVKGVDDLDLGYWDLKTDEPHPARPEWLGVVTEAVTTWKRTAPARNVTPSTVSVVREPEAPPAPVLDAPSTAVPDRPWVDLATNLPAEGIREIAVAAHQAAPVKSVLARVLGVHTEERGWRIGADGEEKVAAKLAKVAARDPRWRFLHSIPVGTRGSDIDHLAIGPGGVFTINSKHHPGSKIWVGGNTFLVDGHKQPYVRNSRHEAERAARLLSAGAGFAVPVDGMVVTVNAGDFVVKAQPTGVHVVQRIQVATWLLRLGPTLDDAQIEAIYEVARRSTTWRD